MDKIKRLLLILWRYKLLVVGLPLLCALLVFFLTRNQERRYISNATLHVALPTNGQISISGQEFKQYETNQFFMDLLEMAMASTSMEMVRLLVLQEYLEGKHNFLSLDKVQGAEQQRTNILRRIRQLRADMQMLEVEQSLDYMIKAILDANKLSIETLKKDLAIKRSGNSTYLQIESNSNNPYKAAYLAECFIEVIRGQHERLAIKRVEDDRSQLEILVKEAEEELERRVKLLEDYKITNNVINLGEHTKAIVNQLVNLEVKRSALNEEVAAQERASRQVLIKLQQQSPTPIDFSVGNRLLLLRDSLSRMLPSQMGNPLLQGARYDALQQARADSLKQQIALQLDNLVEQVPYDPSKARQELVHRYIGYELDREIAAEKLPVVNGELGRLTSYASRFAPLESTIGSMLSDIHTAQESYLILLNKLNLVRSIGKGSDAQISVLSTPSLPLKPEASKRLIMIIGAAFGSFFLICSVFGAHVILDRSIYLSKDFLERNKLPILALLEPPFTEQAGIQQLRKSLLMQPEGQRRLLLTCTRIYDHPDYLAGRLLPLLLVHQQRVLLLNASGHAMSEDVRLQQQGLDYIELPTSIGPFDWKTLDEWTTETERWRREYSSVILLSSAAEENGDWSEWMLYADICVQVFRGGRPFDSLDQEQQAEIAKYCKKRGMALFIRGDMLHPQT